MFENFLKIAFRNIWRQKGYSLINITGLALGMACCLLLFLWVQDEFSFDKFHKKADNLFRVELDMPSSQGDRHSWIISFPLGGALKENIPEVKNAARFYRIRNAMTQYEDKIFNEGGVRAVDPSLLQMFTFPVIRGKIETALNQPRSIVLTEEIARKYFGADDPLGKRITLYNKYDFSVTGVVENIPENSSIKYDMLVPLDFLKEIGQYYQGWRSNNVQTWVELYDSSQAKVVGRKITDLLNVNHPAEDARWVLNLMPIKDINLYAFTNAYTQINSKIQTVIIFAALGVLVLLIACINFMNLSTARSVKRAKEVGLRKVIGAQKKHIIGQFYGESLLITGIALVFSVAIVLVFLPLFNDVTGKKFTLQFLFRIEFILGFLSITLLTGIISGSYPALYLSSFQPVKVLKTKLQFGKKSGFFRKSLVVTQFCISAVVLMSTVIVYQQINFMQNKSLGYDNEQLIYLSLQGDAKKSYSVLKDQLLKDSQILNVSGIQMTPTSISSRAKGARWDGKDSRVKPSVFYSDVDFNYVETMKIKMVEGRSFSKGFTSDTTDAFIVNEEVAKLVDLNSAVGKRFEFMGVQGKIIGVMKDFHFQSVKKGIEFLVLMANPDNINHVIVRLQGGNIESALGHVKSTWQKIIPQFPFGYKFFNDDFAKTFKSDQRIGKILKYTTSLIIFIACIGLFGLASFMAEKRTKEIGIRKTLGASIPRVTYMLLKDFLYWVLIANIIAWPIAYLIMNKWLTNFAYSIPINLGVFLGTTVITALIAVFTVSYQSIKAATINPVDSLKYE